MKITLKELRQLIKESLITELYTKAWFFDDKWFDVDPRDPHQRVANEKFGTSEKWMLDNGGIKQHNLAFTVNRLNRENLNIIQNRLMDTDVALHKEVLIYDQRGNPVLSGTAEDIMNAKSPRDLPIKMYEGKMSTELSSDRWKYDPNMTMQQLQRDINVFFQQMAGDLGLEIEDLSDPGFMDYLGDTLSDKKTPVDVIDRIMDNIEKHRRIWI